MSATPTPSPDALPIPEGVKHTPGPWKHDGKLIAWSDPDIIAVLATTDIGGCDGQTQVANARLIAASPDLLDALRSVLPFLRTAEALWEDAPYPDALASKLARAEAAIRAAQTGER